MDSLRGASKAPFKGLKAAYRGTNTSNTAASCSRLASWYRCISCQAVVRDCGQGCGPQGQDPMGVRVVDIRVLTELSGAWDLTHPRPCLCLKHPWRAMAARGHTALTFSWLAPREGVEGAVLHGERTGEQSTCCHCSRERRGTHWSSPPSKRHSVPTGWTGRLGRRGRCLKLHGQ